MSTSRRLSHTHLGLFTESLEPRRLFAGQVFPGEGPVDLNGPNYLYTADFNGDARPDLAISNNGNTVSIALNDGQGGFLPVTQYTTGLQALEVDGGDFTGDGKLDLVVACASALSVAVLPGNGDGTFGTAITTTFQFGNYMPEHLAVGDFDKNGKLDLVWSHQSSGGSINLMPGPGNGSFGTMSYFGPASAKELIAADFTGDGWLDIVATSDTGVYLTRTCAPPVRRSSGPSRRWRLT